MKIAPLGRQHAEIRFFYGVRHFFGKAKLLAYGFHHRPFHSHVIRQEALEWTDHVTQVSLACVVKQCPQFVIGQDVLCRVNAVLCDAVEITGMPVETALHGQRMCDVFDANLIDFGVDQIDLFAC